MKWTVLGFQSPYPGPGGATPGYLLETSSGKYILIDCGSGVMAELAHYLPTYQLEALMLSHLHHDHIADVLTLQYALHLQHIQGKRKKPLPVYAPRRPESWWQKLRFRTVTEPVDIESQTKIDVDGVSIAFHRTDHGIPCYAMEIREGFRTILYGADSGVKTDWENMCREPDLFVCEATFLEAQIPEDNVPHLSARQAAQAAERIGAKALLLTHVYPDNDLEDIRREATPHFSGDLYVAEKGWNIAL